ncbi:MAG: ABC transporter substrate-binding protein, partial [Actinomycetota bacterium]|nr:ABC transporter substrate-binding protein [Actinomycetota bacterium]
MPLNRRQFIQLSLGAAAVATLPGCGIGGDSESSGSGAKKGGTLRIGAVGSASNIVTDPHGTIPNDSDFFKMQLMFDALTVPTTGDTNVAPRLVADWESDDELRVWRFNLPEGATFHDGSELTAEDVEWSVRRLFETGGPTRVPVNAVGDINADGNALVLTTPAPNSIVPLLVRLQTMTVRAGTTDFDKAVGTGPFKLESFSNGNSRLVRNDAWHHAPPLLDAVEITRFDSVAALSNAVLSGQ